MIALTDVTVLTKLHVTVGLVVLALFEFCSAMYVFGRKGKAGKGAKLVLGSHRIVGYVFLLYWVWPIIVGLGLLGRFAELGDGFRVDERPIYMDARTFYHAFLGVVVLLLLLLKISFVRVYTAYRMQARTLGFVITLCALATWAISGLFWLAMFGSPVVE
jgi:hypothetical protein